MDLSGEFGLQSIASVIQKQPSVKLQNERLLSSTGTLLSSPGTWTNFSTHHKKDFDEDKSDLNLFERPRPTKQNPFPAPKISSILTSNSKQLEPYTSDGGIRNRLVIVMVGLPARGKTFIAMKLCRYLSWIGLKVKMFNIGSYRRRLFSHLTVGTTSKDFFKQSADAVKVRQNIAKVAISDLVEFLDGDGQVGILDGTNSTIPRRDLIRNCIWAKKKELGIRFRILFVESICTCNALIERNILDAKLSNPDYESVNPDEAVRDFRARILQYEKAYDPVSNIDGSFIKLINSGEQIVGHAVYGYIECRVMNFLMHLNLNKKPIFFTRHGESDYNVEGRVGGDARLSVSGKEYSKKLAEWFSLQPECSKVTISVRGFMNIAGTYIMQNNFTNGMPTFKNDFKDRVIWFFSRSSRWVITKWKFLGVRDISVHLEKGQIYALLDEENVASPEEGDIINWQIWDDSGEKLSTCFVNLEFIKEAGCKLWCSTLRRTIQTTAAFKRMKAIKWRALSEIEAGTCDGYTYKEIEENFPDEFLKRQEDKLCYRYPGGESYKDVIQRLEPVIFELERSRLPVIVVGHRAVLRCLYGYFNGTPEEDIPYLELPLHEVIKLSPGPYGTKIRKFPFGCIDLDKSTAYASLSDLALKKSGRRKMPRVNSFSEHYLSF